MLLEPQDCYDYLGIDYADEMVARRIQVLISTVDSYLAGAIGKDYEAAIHPDNLAKAKEIGLMLVGELYDSRSATAKERSTTRTLLSSMLLQLQVEFDAGEGNRDESVR